jgi:hypothetical protein
MEYRRDHKGEVKRGDQGTPSSSHYRTGTACPAHISATGQVIDLNAWHHAIHQVTGDMALRFNRATADDLERWSRMLRTVAEEMDGRLSRCGSE